MKLVLVLQMLLAVYSNPLPATDIAETVAKAATNFEARSSSAANFTFTESFRNQNFNSKGNTTLDVSDTFDVVILEGAPYYRHTSHNGKPLSSGEERKEEAKMNDVGKARRAGDRTAGLYPHGLNISLPIADLAKNFTLKPVEEAYFNGRKTIVIDAVPSKEFLESPRRDTFAKAIQMRLWIDEQDIEFSRLRVDVVRGGSRYEPGAVIEVDYEKIRNEVWLRKRFHFKGGVVDGSHFVPAEAEQLCFNFLKFSSSSSIVIP